MERRSYAFFCLNINVADLLISFLAIYFLNSQNENKK